MRTLDLTAKPPAADLVASLLAAEKVSAVPAAAALTPRVVSFRFRDVRNPATGGLETIVVESTAPNVTARARMAKHAANMTDGCPWPQVPFMDAMYLLGIARIIVQAPEIPAAHAWMLDNPGIVAKVREVLEEHDRRYFCGVDAAGALCADVSRMERPWPDVGDPPNGGVGAS